MWESVLRRGGREERSGGGLEKCRGRCKEGLGGVACGEVWKEVEGNVKLGVGESKVWGLFLVPIFPN